MAASIHSITDEHARRLWRAWVEARETAVRSPGVETWRIAVASWDAFKAAFDKVR